MAGRTCPKCRQATLIARREPKVLRLACVRCGYKTEKPVISKGG